MASFKNRTAGVLTAGLTLSLLSACNDGLPATFPVRLPDGSVMEVGRGYGIPSFANSRWAILYNDSSQDLVGRVEFGPSGEVVRVLDQSIAPSTIGALIVLDGAAHAADFPGMTYVAVAFAAENESGIGFAGVGKAHLGPIELATTTWQVWGTREGDRFVGTMAQATILSPGAGSMEIFNNFIGQDAIIGIPAELLEDHDEPNNGFAQATPLTLGQPHTASLDPPGDEDWFTFTLVEPGAIEIETSGASGDTVLELYGGNMVLAAFDDDGGAETFSRIGPSVFPAGTYFVKVREYNSARRLFRYQIVVRLGVNPPISQPTV